LRLDVWHRIATDLRPAQLDRISARLVGFDELPAQFDDYMKGRVTGRTVVRID
jgi:alcohol dehydrogenase